MFECVKTLLSGKNPLEIDVEDDLSRFESATEEYVEAANAYREAVQDAGKLTEEDVSGYAAHAKTVAAADMVREAWEQRFGMYTIQEGLPMFDIENRKNLEETLNQWQEEAESARDALYDTLLDAYDGEEERGLQLLPTVQREHMDPGHKSLIQQVEEDVADCARKHELEERFGEAWRSARETRDKGIH